MLRNNLIIAVRNFLNHPIYSAINVSGLVLGLTCSLFIFLWVMDELSYDRYHPDNERVYKLMENYSHMDQGISTDQWTHGLLGQALKNEIPEIEQTARAAWTRELFTYGTTSNYEWGHHAEAAIFEVLNIKLVEGNIRHALPGNNSVAISEKMARKYFRNEKALGKTFRFDNRRDVTVTAVFEDLPENATETFEFIIPFQIPDDGESGWEFTVLKLNNKANKSLTDLKIAEYTKKHAQPSASPPPPPPFLFSMLDWRLHDSFVNGKQSGGRINYVLSFSAVGVLILIIACINFMNLSTARSMNRSREVGIRKVAGASRQVLIRQFLMESTLLSFLSMGIALLMVHLLLPLFNSFTGKQIMVDYLNPAIGGSIIGIALLTGLIAGSYPAFFLASFRPASVLKGNLQAVFSGASLRRALVVFQFGLSMVIIIAAMVVSEQIDYMQNANLGYDKNNVISIDPNEEISKNYNAFRNEMLQNPLIESVSRGDCAPMEIDGYDYYDWDGKSPDDNAFFNGANCDYEYLETMRFKFLKGRNFSPEFPSDSTHIIITQEVANLMGAANPIGQYLEAGDGRKLQIIGVIEDFYNLSMKVHRHPTLFSLEVGTPYAASLRIFIRYKAGSVIPSLEYTQGLYKKYVTSFPIQYSFVDREFEKQFRTELITATLANCFTGIAIIISCLGLFGLASFSTERRTKEIGVRKVMGASVSQLTILLCKDFTRLILYAVILGSPIAYYLMEQYLTRYPYHTQINPSMFLIPALVMFTISISIVSWQAIKAALGNPVVALRSE